MLSNVSGDSFNSPGIFRDVVLRVATRDARLLHKKSNDAGSGFLVAIADMLPSNNQVVRCQYDRDTVLAGICALKTSDVHQDFTSL